MALVQATLKAEIKQLMTDMRTRENVSDDDFADKLASAFDSYIKSATITVIGVVTAGSATTQTQTVPVTATIS